MKLHRNFRTTLVCGFLFCIAATIAAPAQSVYFTTLATFDGTNGLLSFQPLVQASDGNIYGTTIQGGSNNFNSGTIFRLSPAGTLTTIYNFCSEQNCTDGTGPQGVIRPTNGFLYGTTIGGGAYNYGTVFAFSASGNLTTLYSFCAQSGCPDGGTPHMLVQASDGNFYGTTGEGGAYGSGTAFKITPTGDLTTLYSFCSQPNCVDGAGVGAMVQASDGNFYGTGSGGNYGNDCPYGCGTIFKMTPAGVLTTLYSFCAQSGCPDGATPDAPLMLASDGNLYGTTINGGAYGWGTVFKITLGGTLTTLVAFDGSDGGATYAGLMQATDGNLYSVSSNGGRYGYGTVYRVTLGGTLTTLHDFCASGLPCADGYGPQAGLLQARDGSFYGTTTAGGYGNGVWGTAFRLGVVQVCAICRP